MNKGAHAAVPRDASHVWRYQTCDLTFAVTVHFSALTTCLINCFLTGFSIHIFSYYSACSLNSFPTFFSICTGAVHALSIDFSTCFAFHFLCLLRPLVIILLAQLLLRSKSGIVLGQESSVSVQDEEKSSLSNENG